MATEDDGSARQALRLAAAVARRHYVDDRSKIEIAAEFGLSRFKVARLLERARAQGLVRIEIRDPYAVDAQLSRRLRDVLGIRRALVLGGVTDARIDVGALAALHLRDVLEPGSTLGIAWSRSTQALVEQPVISKVSMRWLTRWPIRAVPAKALACSLYTMYSLGSGCKRSSISQARRSQRRKWGE